MTEAIIVALITGGLGLAGSLIANGKSAQAMDAKLDKQQAVMNTKLDNLTRELRENNSLTQKIPVMEAKLESLQKHLEDLERRVGGAA